jgi:hypothetical protein
MTGLDSNRGPIPNDKQGCYPLSYAPRISIQLRLKRKSNSKYLIFIIYIVSLTLDAINEKGHACQRAFLPFIRFWKLDLLNLNLRNDSLLSLRAIVSTCIYDSGDIHIQIL